MKDRYARLDLGKLPKSYKDEFDEMHKNTYGFTDDDLNDIFAENFNEMYSLVEMKYPDALKTGGTIKKVKPAKVKKVSPKKKPEIPENLRKKLTEEEIDRIEDIFDKSKELNDEGLEKMLVAMIGLSEAQAKKWVAYRDKYLNLHGGDGKKYSMRKKARKEARKEKDIVKTRDGKEFDRRSKKNVGKTFYDENGKAWKCKKYEPKLDECIMEDAEGKEITGCLKDMYVSNPVKKREKGNLVDDCQEVLKEAGYTIKEHRAGKKRIRRSAPRPEKEIIKERVADTFTPIMKDISGSKEKDEKNKEVIAALERIQGLFTKLFNRLNNLAEDGKAEAIEKIEKLLREIIGE